MRKLPRTRHVLQTMRSARCVQILPKLQTKKKTPDRRRVILRGQDAKKNF